MAPFNPKERVIEYIIKEKVGGKRDEEKLQISTVREFIALVGARTSLPGGGCVAALVSSLGSALACMVSYLTYGTRKYENVDAPIRKILPAFHSAYHDIAQLIDQDAISYNKYMVSWLLLSHNLYNVVIFKRSQEDYQRQQKKRRPSKCDSEKI